MKKKRQSPKSKVDIFLVIMTIATVLLLVIWIIKDLNPQDNIEETTVIEQYGIDDFKKSTLADIQQLIKKDSLSFIYIGYKGCGACDDFASTLSRVSQRYNMDVYYLDIKEIDKSSKEWKTFTEKLTKKVSISTKEDEKTYTHTKTIGKFLYENGYTPSFVVFKSNKFINGNIGGMEVEKLYEFLEEAGFEKNS